MPAMRSISMSPSPSSRHPRRAARSLSFTGGRLYDQWFEGSKDRRLGSSCVREDPGARTAPSNLRTLELCLCLDGHAFEKSPEVLQLQTIGDVVDALFPELG